MIMRLQQQQQQHRHRVVRPLLIQQQLLLSGRFTRRIMIITTIVFVFVLVILSTLVLKSSTLHYEASQLRNDYNNNYYNNNNNNIPISNQRQQIIQQQQKEESLLNKLVYIGYFGLGHRLSKLSAAYHLAKTQLNVPILEIQWNNDCDGIEIFTKLFGTNRIVLRKPIQNIVDYQNKTILIRNDVNGYYAGQAYKNFKLPINVKDTKMNLWRNKLYNDYIFFTWLEKQFIYKDIVNKFTLNWTDYTVIGIHIRAGNGEQEHFIQSKRNNVLTDTTNTIQYIQLLIYDLINVIKNTKKNIIKPPLIFVATDTVSWIQQLHDIFQQHKIPVISFPQERVEIGKGVSYNAWKNDNNNNKCINGWKYSYIDMSLLSKVSMLIASSRSTFTQIVPLSIILNNNNNDKQNQKLFCEMVLNNNNNNNEQQRQQQRQQQLMTCFNTISGWLFRNETYSTHTVIDNKIITKSSNSTYKQQQQHLTPPHKVMIHLPDIWNTNDNQNKINSAKEFLMSKNGDDYNNNIYYYGPKFNRGYRNKKIKFQHNWTYA